MAVAATEPKIRILESGPHGFPLVSLSSLVVDELRQNRATPHPSALIETCPLLLLAGFGQTATTPPLRNGAMAATEAGGPPAVSDGVEVAPRVLEGHAVDEQQDGARPVEDEAAEVVQQAEESEQTPEHDRQCSSPIPTPATVDSSLTSIPSDESPLRNNRQPQPGCSLHISFSR